MYIVLTCNKAGPITGNKKPWYKNSNNCFCTKGCATCATALQKSKEFIKCINAGKSLTSSGVNWYQSSVSISNFLGSNEYSPLKPVANT